MGTYVEVLGVDFAMLGLEFLLRDEHALTEEVLVDLLAVRLGNQPLIMSVHARYAALVHTHIFAVVVRVGKVLLLG